MEKKLFRFLEKEIPLIRDANAHYYTYTMTTRLTKGEALKHQRGIQPYSYTHGKSKIFI